VIDEGVRADPTAAVTQLHEAWSRRIPLVIEAAVAPATFRAPETVTAPLWQVGANVQLWADRLHFLMWANSYDAQTPTEEPIWWWGRKAVRLGAREGGEADVVLPDGTPAWVDGGPRGTAAAEQRGVVLVAAESVELGYLTPLPEPTEPSATLAPDQMAAVAHVGGGARIIAPAGSGKTRVLTERYRHLLVDRGYER
jgi:DNA helicase-2/ATP-dependent DNA helicase PcrA